MTLTQRNRPLVENKMHVARRLSVKINLSLASLGIHRRRGTDDLDVEAAGKRLNVREDEFTVRLDVRSRQCVVELRQAERDEDAEDAGVVAKVQVESLVDGEGDGVVVKGDVDLGRGRGQDMVLHAGEDLFDVACCMLVSFLEGCIIQCSIVYLYR